MALDVDVTGVTATGAVGTVLVWGQVATGSTALWAPIVPGFLFLVDETTGAYLTDEEGAFLIVSDGSTPAEWSNIAPGGSANWVDVVTS